VKGEERYLPLYEPKFIFQYDHRHSTFHNATADDLKTGNTANVETGNKANQKFEILPRYWVKIELVLQQLNSKSSKYLSGYRGVTSPTNERSIISCLFPVSAVQHNMWLLFFDSQDLTPVFLSMLNSFMEDYIARQKMSSYLNQFVLKQLPFFTPEMFASILTPLQACKFSFSSMLLELIYTAESLKPFANDCSYDGPPFIWDEERRFEIRCELDALYFHLYLGTLSDWQTQGTPELLAYLPTPRHAVEYIMETFPIVKRKDLRDYGEYRTKLRILEIYDQMTHCLATTTEYRSTLNPLPGPPCDKEGNFIPVDKWDKYNWPKHIHKRNGSK
jgi:hypothetical protein